MMVITRMKQARTQATVSLMTLLACCTYAFALNPSLEINQYAHTAWKVRDGFAQGEITAIAQAPDGYLWLGTQFGLFRFDGVRVTNWQPPPEQHVPPGQIFSLLVSHDGTLWIGAKGLASWKDGKLTWYPKFTDQYIFALREDREGDVWIGSSGIPTGTLCAVRKGAISCLADNSGYFRSGVYAIYEDRSGAVWAGVKDGLLRCKPGLPRFYSLPGENNGIWSIGEDDNGALLVGWKGGINRFNDGNLEP
jgi:ligand-binding sensor domain-containing protein